MLSLQSDLKELLEELKLKIDASVVTIALSSELYISTDEDYVLDFWQDYKQLRQPHIEKNNILVPILRKNSLRVLMCVEKVQPKVNDAMLVLTWMLNNIDQLEHAMLSDSEPAASERIDQDLKVLARPCSPGIAMGKVFLLNAHINYNAENSGITDKDAEIIRLSSAVKQVCDEMQTIGGLLVSAIKNAPELFNAYYSMLDRHGIVQEASIIIMEQACSAEFAVQLVIKNYAEKFSKLSDPYLRARAIDLKDLGNRIIDRLNSKQEVKAN